MVYPVPLITTSRKITDNVVITSSPFLRGGYFNFGARMALINHNGSIVVWSAMPYGPEVIKGLQLLTGDLKADKFNVTHLIIPDNEHTMAIKSFKEVYPEAKIIGSDSVTFDKFEIDYKIPETLGNQLLSKKELSTDVGIKEDTILNNFEFVFLPFHANKELVVYESNSKILFEADLIFNLGAEGTTTGKVVSEQYSPQTGYPKGFNPHSGWSFLTRFLQPHSSLGTFFFNLLASKKSGPGLKAIYGWNFEKIVLCHGNIIEKDAKSTFKHVFKSYV
ncbi:hypothetical protein DFJ63DRAFT_25213 [Scheffersomyces coipomensis]|uniref:uncharacterized protein n=1 Tax=Scheffersomyces coipomensis TaxID=1788519 RepID=UPI00315CF9C0